MNYAIYFTPAPAPIERVVSMNGTRVGDLALEAGQHYVAKESAVDHRLDYITADPVTDVAARPAPADPPAFTAGAPATWSGLPPGATVRVIDPLASPPAEVGSAAADGAGDLAVTLPEAGAWRLTVDEAWPWLAVSFDVTVAAP